MDTLPVSDYKMLYVGLQQGIWGPMGHYTQAYHNYVMQHNIQQTQIAVATGKKFKGVSPKLFHEVFPTIDEFSSLGTAAEARKIKSREVIATQTAKNLLGPGAPKWLQDKAGL